MRPKYLIILGACVWSACVVTDVGNPETPEPTENTPLEIQAFVETMPNALTLESGVEITHAWVSLDRFSAEHCEVEDQEDLEDLKIEGPVVVDLISGRSYPAPIELPSEERFCELELEFKPAELEGVSGVPVDFEGLSVMVRGVRKDGTVFEIRGNFSDGFKLEGEVQLETMDALILGFAANTWITAADLDGLQGDPILVDDDVNSEVYETFRDNFKRSSRLFRDDDRDGELDEDEDDDALARYL